MKIKEGFVHRQIAGSDIIVPVGKRCWEFDGMLTLNETAAFIWKQLEQGANMDMITDAVLNEYDTDRQNAAACIAQFIDQLRGIGCIED